MTGTRQSDREILKNDGNLKNLTETDFLGKFIRCRLQMYQNHTQVVNNGYSSSFYIFPITDKEGINIMNEMKKGMKGFR